MEPEGSLPRYKCPPPVSILSQTNPVQASPSHFLKIHLYIIFPYKPGSSKWAFSLGFPHQNPECTSTLPHTCYVLHPPQSSDLLTRTILGEEYRSLSSSLRSFLHSRYPVPLRPTYAPQHPILKHPQPTFLPQCERPRFTSIQNNRQNYSSVHLNLYIFG